MEDLEFRLALDQLRECIRSRDDDEVENALMELDSVTLEMERWPMELFDGLEGLAKNQNFLSLGKSWKLFYFIKSNWEQIPDTAKESLRQVLADAFDNCGDWMGAFVIGEFLGEHYADETTLVILTKLAKAKIHWKEFVPHALEALAKTGEKTPLRERAILQLKELAENESEYVREEALLSLAKLGARA
jgi:hypothetical protein